MGVYPAIAAGFGGLALIGGIFYAGDHFGSPKTTATMDKIIAANNAAYAKTVLDANAAEDCCQ